MDLCSKKGASAVLKKYDVLPSKRMGQNFLIDKSVLRKIVRTAELKPKDVVLEIGPGIGTLTQELARAVSADRPAKSGGRIIAVEKDSRMVEILKETLKDFDNTEIIHGDALKIDPKSYKLQVTSYKIIANLPYNVASAVIRKFLEEKNPPLEMILMVQKEVAQRICAKPRKMSLLAISVQFYSDVKIISYVSKKSFYPQPKVDSAIIKIKHISPEDGHLEAARINRGLASGAEDLFFKIVKAGFSQPRKQLINNLAKKLKKEKQDIKVWLLKNNIEPSRRAETLTVNDWIMLTKSIK